MFFLSGLTSISFVSVLIHRSFFIFLVNFLPAVPVKARIGVPGCKQFSYQPMQHASFFTLKNPMHYYECNNNPSLVTKMVRMSKNETSIDNNRGCMENLPNFSLQEEQVKLYRLIHIRLSKVQ